MSTTIIIIGAVVSVAFGFFLVGASLGVIAMEKDDPNCLAGRLSGPIMGYSWIVGMLFGFALIMTLIWRSILL
jgi:hypothetical protein